MSTPLITILDTTADEAGPNQLVNHAYLKTDVLHNGMAFIVSIGAGDTVLIEGKGAAADASWITLQECTSSGVYDVKVTPVFRASRSVDGGSADSLVRVININNQNLTAHE